MLTVYASSSTVAILSLIPQAEIEIAAERLFEINMLLNSSLNCDKYFLACEHVVHSVEDSLVLTGTYKPSDVPLIYLGVTLAWFRKTLFPIPDKLAIYLAKLNRKDMEALAHLGCCYVVKMEGVHMTLVP